MGLAMDARTRACARMRGVRGCARLKFQSLNVVLRILEMMKSLLRSRVPEHRSFGLYVYIQLIYQLAYNQVGTVPIHS